MSAHEISFYETAAQVILILLIVIGIEARMFGRPSSWVIAQIFVFMIVAMVGGEATALYVLHKGEASSGASGVVWLAIGIGLFLAFVRAYPGYSKSERPFL